MRTLNVLALAILVMVWSALPATAQSSTDMTWGVQVGAGEGYGTIPKGRNITREAKPTFNGGVFAVLPLGGGFKFQPEFKFDHRDITIGGIPTKVDYLSVPILLRNDFLGIFVTQGVALDFVARATVFNVNFKSTLTSPDVAIVLGVGKKVGRVSVEGRWDTGLRTFQKGINASGVRLRAVTGVLSVYLK